MWRGVPTGESQYHALELVLERRFSRGLQARFGYTYSQLNNNGAESAQGDNGINGGVQNPADPLEWRLSADDMPHVFLPGSPGRCPDRSDGRQRGRRRSSPAGMSAASSGTRADAR